MKERPHPETVKWLNKTRKNTKSTHNLKCDFIHKYANRLRKNKTYAEKEIRTWLNFYHIKHKFQVPVFTGRKYYILDFVVYSGTLKICIEIDGEYHLKSEMIRKDKMRDMDLNKLGFIVIRITNDDAVKYPYELIGKLKFLGVKTKTKDYGLSRKQQRSGREF
jgi:very-short-patch-repair endonuclease